jgi:hypothetical protein
MRAGWVRFESAPSLKVGQNSTGVDKGMMRRDRLRTHGHPAGVVPS